MAGNITTLRYDARGNIVEQIDPQQPNLTTYAANDNPTSITDPAALRRTAPSTSAAT
jgi:uncharacterized protein RhaS with RHS repeats